MWDLSQASLTQLRHITLTRQIWVEQYSLPKYHTFTSLVTDTERLYSIERHFSITQFLGSRDLFLPPSLVSRLGGGGGGARREEEGRYGEQVFLTLRVAKNDAKQFF